MCPKMIFPGRTARKFVIATYAIVYEAQVRPKIAEYVGPIQLSDSVVLVVTVKYIRPLPPGPLFARKRFGTANTLKSRLIGHWRYPGFAYSHR